MASDEMRPQLFKLESCSDSARPELSNYYFNADSREDAEDGDSEW